MRSLKAAFLYFAIVFGAGFILGTLRVLWLVPRVGVRAAELMETPIMLAVSWLAARWVVGRIGVPATTAARLGMGLAALALLLGAEFGLVLGLRGLTLAEYLATRDPVSGTVYYFSVAAFGGLPLLVDRRPA